MVVSLASEPDPAGALRDAAEHLAPGDELLVRAPCRRSQAALQELAVDGHTVAGLTLLCEEAGLEPTQVRLLREPGAGVTPPRIDARGVDITLGRITARGLNAAELDEFQAHGIELRAARRAEFLDSPLCSVIVAGRRSRPFRGDNREVIAVGGIAPTAWNEGARRARGRLLAFVDGGAVPEAGWLEALLEIYAADSDVGAVGCLVLTPEGLIAHAGIVFDPFGVPYHAYRGVPPELAAGSTRAVPALAGCGLLVARRTFVALGGFDVGLPTDHALIDLSLRLRARSLVPVYCPRSVLRLREAPGADRREEATVGDRLLSEKWEGRLWRDERLLVEDGVDPVDARPRASAMRGRCGLAWSAPLFVRSGYAEEARSFVLALDDAGYAVTPIDVAGVASGLGAADDRLTELTEAPLPSPFAEVVHYHGPGIPLRPDATRRVWRTMFEAESLPPNWADYANQMDEVWVPSDFNLESFARAGVRPSKLRKLAGGLDFRPYDPDVPALPLAGARGFVFLSALIPQRRKGWDVLLRAYYEEFGADDDVSLVVKVTAGPEHASWFADELDAFVRRDLARDPAASPRVLFLRHDFEPELMPQLYRAADAYVLPSRGEGWSRTAMEAMAMGLPVIATRWGGQLEFMNDANSYLLDCSVEPIDELAAHELPMFRGQRWAEPSVAHLRELMRRVFEKPGEAATRGAQARLDVVSGYGPDRMAAALLERIEGLGIKPMRKPRRRPQPARPRARPAEDPAPVVWSSPLLNRTGYATEARAFILALDRAGIDVRANPSFLGPTDYQPPSAADRRLRALIARKPPERFVHVVHSPSPGFAIDAPAARTIWRTMFETDGLPADWVAKANKVDAVWVPSHHNLESFVRAGVDERKLRWVPAGLEVELYDQTVPPLQIPDAHGFVFLSVFGWGRRKGWDVLARAYLEEFAAGDDVSLVIVTTGTLGRTVDEQRAELEHFVRKELGRDPKTGPQIVTLELDLLPEEMPRLYRAADAYVQPSRGEGFPRPPLEAMAMGLPTIGSRCPGMVEFMTDENSYLVDCEWQPVPEYAAREFPLYRGHRWSEPSVEQLRHHMRNVFEHRRDAEAKGEKARDEVLSTWDWRRLASEVTSALEELGCAPAQREARAQRPTSSLGELGDAFRRGWAAGDSDLDRVAPQLDAPLRRVEAGRLLLHDVTGEELGQSDAAPEPDLTRCSVVVAGHDLETVRATVGNAEVVPVKLTDGLSLAAAWNLGAARATGRYVAFLDERSAPEPGWLEALLQTNAELPGVGVVGSRLEHEGAVVHTGVALGALGAPYLLYQGVPTDAPEVARRRPLSAVTGSGLLVERSTFNAAGGFDEAYPDGHEGIDLSLQLRSRGLSAVYCPESRIRHPTIELDPAGDRRLFRQWAKRLGAEDEAICRQDGTDVLRARPTKSAVSVPSSVRWTASLHTRTGYAEEARSLILALDRAGVDITAEAMDLGDLITQLRPEDHRLLQLARAEPGEDFVQVHHYPNTLYRASAPAVRNIWRTMFESDGLPNDWVLRANEMDEVWVPSAFNVETFARAGVSPEKLHIVPGGLQLEGYDPSVEPLSLPGLDGFVFLSIFGWEPRKGWDVLLRAYLEEFGPDEDVTLALKIFPHYLISSQDLYDTIAAHSVGATGRPPSQQPRVMMIEHAVAPADMPRLYRAADAFVLPSRGEGWGRTHMEAMAMGLPVIATRWSGNLEFMNDENSYLVDCRLTKVSEEVALECPHYRGHNWAEPSIPHLRRLMREVYEDRAEAGRRGARARREVLEGFGIDRSAAVVLERLEELGAPARREARTPHPPRVLWEGPQLGDDDCSRFNRALSRSVLESTRVSLALRSTAPERLVPAEVTPAGPSGRPFTGPPEAVITSAPVPAEPPASGRWIGLATWPHGSLPKSWLDASRRMDEIWVPSEYLHDCCVRSGIEPHKLAAIRPSIDTTRHRPGAKPLTLATRKSFRFLHFGGDGKDEGTDALIEAFTATFGAQDDVCLVVVPRLGSHGIHRVIERLRAEPLAPEVLLLDHEAGAELPQLAAACNCLVHCPRADTGWLQLAEAQACGLPAVVANHGTARELCDPTAVFFAAAMAVQLPERRIDDVETVDFPWWAEIDRDGLAEALRAAAENPEQTRELGLRASKYIRSSFSPEVAVAEVVNRLGAGRRPATAADGPAPLSLCMMVRNEDRYLGDCLESVEGLVSEIVIVDTGSTDRTVEIARERGAQVHFLPWADDFAAPRNAAISHATQPWILMIDGDHTLDPASRDEVRRLAHTHSLTAYMLRGINYLDPAGIHIVEGYDPRLFPNHPAIRFSGSVHEQLTCSEPELGFQAVPCGVVLHHHGVRADDYSRVPKLLRDVPMLEAAVATDPDDPFQSFNLGSTYLWLGRFADAELELRRSLELCRSRSAPTSYPQYMLNVQLNLAKALMGQARHLEAAAECAEVARTAPGLAEAHALQGIALARLGSLDEAATCFEMSLRAPDWPMYGTADPSWRSWRSLLGIAEIRLAQGRWEDALAAAEGALELSPDKTGAWSLLAHAYRGLGRVAEAEECMRRAGTG